MIFHRSFSSHYTISLGKQAIYPMRLTMTLKIFAMVTALFLTQLVFANDEDNDLIGTHNLDPISAMKISKPEILQTLRLLRDSGKISAEDYQKSVTEIEKMDDRKLQNLAEEAKEIAKKNPDGAMDILKDKKIDLKKVEDLKNNKKALD